jgi:hypothetical protein
MKNGTYCEVGKKGIVSLDVVSGEILLSCFTENESVTIKLTKEEASILSRALTFENEPM